MHHSHVKTSPPYRTKRYEITQRKPRLLRVPTYTKLPDLFGRNNYQSLYNTSPTSQGHQQRVQYSLKLCKLCHFTLLLSIRSQRRVRDHFCHALASEEGAGRREGAGRGLRRPLHQPTITV